MVRNAGMKRREREERTEEDWMGPKLEEDGPSVYKGIKDIYRLKEQQINLHNSGRAQMAFN